MITGDDAALALRLFALAPARFGGLWLRNADEEELTRLAERLQLRRLPLTIDDDRLIGGIDLADSLAAGRPVRRAGLLDEAHGQGLLIRGAERMPDGLCGRLAQGVDAGGPWLVLRDEGTEEQRAPPALTDRVAFWIDAFRSAEIDAIDASASLPELSEEQAQALAAVSLALGVDSARALLFAGQAAISHAALNGRAEVMEDDVMAAARLVLGPRATRVPESREESEPPPPEQSPQSQSVEPLEDRIVEAIRPHLPAELIAACAGRAASRSGSQGQGARGRSRMRGRPIGARAGSPAGGLRLALVDTLRAAAPWQALRGRGDGRLRLQRGDLRVRRFEDRETLLTIFAVDASGSAAFARLAEAKGAVELMLERAYVRRAEVALIVFRKTGAELLLPPTRSLARARRMLGDMMGGGATPLAAGLEAAHALARAGRARGCTAQIVMLTDGRANVAASGVQSRSAGVADALAAARRVAADGFAATVLDISARPQAEAAALAEALRARLVHLPRADAAGLAAAAA